MRYSETGFWNWLIAASLLILATAGAADAGEFDQARAALDAGEYQKAEDLLEKELAKASPATEALEISMQAAMKSGRVVTAQKRVSALMKVKGTSDPDFVRQAAEIAQRAGEEANALQRYREYLRSNPPKSPELRVALVNMLKLDPDVAAYKLLVNQFGGAEQAWFIGANQLQRLFYEKRSGEGLELAAFLLAKYPDVDHVNFVHEQVSDAAQNHRITGGARDRFVKPLQVLLQSKPSTVEHLLYLFGEARQHAMKPDERLKAALKIQSLAGTPLPADAFEGFHDMRGLQSEADRVGAGQAFLKLDTIYKNSADPADYARYVRVITDSPEVFAIPGKPLLNAGAVQEMVQALVQKNAGQAAPYDHHIRQVAEHYIKDPGAKVAFLQRFAAGCPAQGPSVTMLMEVIPDQAFPPFAAAYAKQHGLQETVILKAQGLPIYKRLGDKAALLQAARDYVTTYPGSFDAKLVSENVLESDLLTPDEKLGLVEDVLRKGGPGNPARNLVGKLSPYKGNAKYQTVVELSKDEDGGTDPVMKTHARICAIAPNPRSPSKRVYDIAEAFLKTYQGAVPGGREQVTSTADATAHDIFVKHMEHVYENPGEIARCAKLWAPRLSMGSDWTRLVGRVRRLRGYETLNDIAPHFLALVEQGAKPDNELWTEMSFAQTPRGADQKTSVFAKVYERMGANNALRYVHDMNRGSWPPELYFFELSKVLTLPDIADASWGRIRSVSNEVTRRARNQKPPAELGQGLWAYYTSTRLSKDLRDLGFEAEVYAQLARGGNDQAAAAWLDQYRKLLDQRTPRGRVQALSNLLGYLPRERNNLQPGRQHHMAIKVIGPMLASLPADAHRMVYIRGSLLDAIEHYLKAAPPNEPERKTAEALQATIGDVLINGASCEDGRKALPCVRDAALAAAEKLDWDRLGRVNEALPRILGWSNDWNANVNIVVKPLADKLMEKGAHEFAYVLSSNLEKKTRMPGNVRENLTLIETEALGKMGVQLIDANKGSALYDLSMADHFYQRENVAKAWELARPKLNLVADNWQSLTQPFVAWLIDRMRKTREEDMMKDAVNLARTVLLKENELDKATAAQIYLSLGDVQRDRQNYQAARIEYESLRNNEALSATQAGSMAKFRLVELLILTQNYGDAELQLERLLDAADPETRAEAYYYLGLLSFRQEDFETARDYVAEVLKLEMYHAEARLLGAEIRLRMRDLGDPDVELTPALLADTIVPTKVLVLKLRDPNLGIVRAGSFVPVTVYTTKGRDSEEVKLFPSTSDPTLFRGEIRTDLGKATPGNTKLEVNGGDQVMYIISKDYQEANGLDFPAKELAIKADAHLAASSGEILTQEEEEKRELEARMRRLAGEQEDETALRDRVRDQRTIRPGSPIYLQVIDYDRDLGDETDTVTVTLKTSSGDILEGFSLKETEPHSAIFRAQAPTGLPLPKAEASDTREGGPPPAVLINTQRNEVWSSVPDGERPKSVEVDTMTSVQVEKVALQVADGTEIRKLRLEGSLIEGFQTIAAYPEETGGATGGLTLTLADGPKRGDTAIASLRSYLRANSDYKAPQQVSFYDRNSTPRRGNRWITAGVSGVFWMPQTETLEFKFLQEPSPGGMQTAYFLIDGKTVLGGKMDAFRINFTKRVTLEKGAHRLELLVRDYPSTSRVVVGYKQPDGTYAALPESWFSVTEHPELADALKPKASIQREGDTFTAVFNKPARLRKLRWTVDDYAGEAVAAKTFTVVADGGKTIVPAEDDFTSGTQNKTLEIAPGDRITVAYEDEKNTRGGDPVLTENLNASFYNGALELVKENIYTDERGERRTVLFHARRCKAGDQVLVRIEDWDLDVSDEREKVPFVARTSSGEELTLEALETGRDEEMHDHAGVFVQRLRFGDQTGGNTLKVQPGDTITVSYLDRENTDPGIPIDREAVVEEASGEDAFFTVYRTSIQMVPDESPAAQARLKRLAQELGEEEAKKVEILRPQIIAAHPDYAEGGGGAPRAAVQAPLLLELTHPVEAKHAGSAVEVHAVAESELKAAEAAGREPTSVKVPLIIQSLESLAQRKGYPIQLQSNQRRGPEEMLTDGVFAGVIRLQLGQPGDPIDDTVVRQDAVFGPTERRDADADPDRVPTIIVSGSDVVRLTYVDAQTREPLAETAVDLLSDARMELLDRSYTINKDTIYLGEAFHIRLTDPDQDVSDERDRVSVRIRSSSGDEVNLDLTETMGHTGVFSSYLRPEYKTPGQQEVNKTDQTLQVDFGDEVTFDFVDEKPLSDTQPIRVTQQGKIRLGTDGQVASFSKRFKDPEMAVKTRFLMAEALFEKAKDLRNLKRKEESEDAIVEGKRILEEALRDYPNTSLAAQGEFLLANLAQEKEAYDEAVGRFTEVINRWPESEYAARSQYHKGICYEKKEEFDQACEEYVKLTYLYPDTPLVQDATVRLGNYYYTMKKYDTAGRIFLQFQKRFPAHRLAAKAMFLAAQCKMKVEQYKAASGVFADLIETYKDDNDLRAEAMYWQGECLFKGRDLMGAYQTFKKLTWDYPATKWAKIARGRLTEEVFARIED